DIKQDWEKRIAGTRPSERSFNFPEVDLKPGEQYWLHLLYDIFKSGTNLHYTQFISQHRKSLPKGFDPSKIDSILTEGGSNITLYGIWIIDPSSKYIP